MEFGGQLVFPRSYTSLLGSENLWPLSVSIGPWQSRRGPWIDICLSFSLEMLVNHYYLIVFTLPRICSSCFWLEFAYLLVSFLVNQLKKKD